MAAGVQEDNTTHTLPRLPGRRAKHDTKANDGRRKDRGHVSCEHVCRRPVGTHVPCDPANTQTRGSSLPAEPGGEQFLKGNPVQNQASAGCQRNTSNEAIRRGWESRIRVCVGDMQRRESAQRRTTEYQAKRPEMKRSRELHRASNASPTRHATPTTTPPSLQVAEAAGRPAADQRQQAAGRRRPRPSHAKDEHEAGNYERPPREMLG